MSLYKISKHTISTYAYVEAPADYDATAITHADAQHDGDVMALATIADVAARLGNDVPSDLSRRAAEEWIEGAECGGWVSLDDATHADLVGYLTAEVEP